MTAPQKPSASTAADHDLAFGSASDRKHYWVDELGTLRTEKLWWIVDAVRQLRSDLTRRLEELYQRTRVIPGILKRLDALEARGDKYIHVDPAAAPKKKP